MSKGESHPERGASVAERMNTDNLNWRSRLSQRGLRSHMRQLTECAKSFGAQYIGRAHVATSRNDPQYVNNDFNCGLDWDRP